jgi:Fe-S oxidoreductase
MAADMKGIKYFLEGGDRRRGPCFGAPDVNPGFPSVSEEEAKKNAEFANSLVDELRAKPLQS